VKKILLFVALFAILCPAAIQLMRPASAVRQAASREPLLAGAHADTDVASIIGRSCGNCHSLKTEWPLYSRIFPFSWMIEHDVETARSHMNLSRWQNYENPEKNALLAEIGSVVRNRIMPPRRYTLIHPEAKLSDAEADAVYQWTRAERRLLSHSPEE
jgi:hypothetical protein